MGQLLRNSAADKQQESNRPDISDLGGNVW